LRWWQVLCRLAVVVAFVLSGAYATLPWWAPTGYLSRRLADHLAGQMGVDVRIDGMSLSWLDGVEIRDLTIYSAGRFGSQPLATVQSVRTELSPVELLLHRRLAWMELVKPRLYVRLDGEGNVNLRPLTRLRQDVAIDRINVSQGRATLKLSDDPRVIALKVPSLQFDAGRVREITMSAALIQSGEVGEAPVSLSPGPWSDPTAAASAVLTFSNVDLSQLPVAAAGALPLERLSGRCDGAVDLKVNHEGVVESFSLDVRIRRLDVQPTGGIKLPVIDEAGFRISAAYDHLTRALQLRSASIRLPGVDLRGEAKVFAEAFSGHWEAVESVELEGKVYPARLAALLTGRRLLPGEVGVTGPVDVTVSAQRQHAKLRLRLTADATAAAVEHKAAVLKPAARVCRMGLGGDLDHRTSAFIVNESWLDLAGNRFSGHGALVSLRRFARRLSQRRGRGIGEILLAELARLDWRGSWEIHDPNSLLDLIPPPAGPAAWRDVKLRGAVTGRWFIHHAPATRVHVSFLAAADTSLAVADWFIKPTGRALHLDMGAAIDANHTSLNDLDLSLTVGGARLAVDRAKLTAGRGDGEGGTEGGAEGGIEFTGRVAAEKLDALLACVPAAKGLAGRLRGRLTGRLAVHLAPRRRRGRLSLDLNGTHVALGPWFDKPAGQEAEVHVDLRREASAASGGADLLACTWASPHGEVTVNCTFPAAPSAGEEAWTLPPEELDWIAEAAAKDVRRLLDSSPALTERLAGDRLSGPLKLTGQGKLRRGVLDASVFCDATGLRYVASAPGGARKAAGTKLSLRLRARLARKEDRLLAHVRDGELNFAGSRLAVSGRAELLPGKLLEGKKPWPQPGLGSLQIDANGSVLAEEALGDLVPRIGRLMRRHGVAGRLGVQTAATFDGNSIRAACHLEAARLAVARLPAPPGWAPGTKPGGAAAQASFAVTCPADLSRIALRDVHVRLGEAQLLAEASADLPAGADGLPEKLGTISGHLAVSSRRLEALETLLPALKPYGLSGRAFVEMDLTDAAEGVVSRGTVRLDGLRGRVRGKEVAVHGELLVEKLTPRWGLSLKGRIDPNDPQWGDFIEDNFPDVWRFRTDGLELRAGSSHGWLLADLSDLPGKACGSFHFLAERLDLQELSEWASDAKASAAARPSYKLTDFELEAVRAKARRLAAAARKYLAEARIDGRVSVDRLRSYDISVDQVYDVRRLELTASIADGHARIDYAGGLNGGLMSERYSTPLTGPAASVTCQSVLGNVLGEENIQPQLAKFFPGNTVHGTFSRREKVSAGLVDVLAGAIDPRYPVRRVGTGKTLTIDGVTQGRAAPSFITKIFTGLNLAKYHYRKMTAFAEFLPDGTAKNDMVFDGKTYDLYMEGTTDAENIGRYEIGLILLGTPQSAEWNHTYRQGRIPLLNFRARIEGGKMHHEDVSYLWPNETLFVIFLKNNIFYRIWLAAGKNK
jgi:hypothetical protein